MSDTRLTPITPLKARTSRGVRDLSKRVSQTFPDMVAHQHLQDAASAIDAGRFEGARRHLDAAVSSFTPQNIRRHGVWDDVGFTHAKQYMNEAHRHLLLVKDIQDQSGVNQQQMAQRREQRLSEEQDKAMRNAQKQPAGKSDGAASGPDNPAPASTAVAASWEDIGEAIELSVKGKSPAAHRLARQGKALPDGSFPIGSKSALDKARAAYGRANPAKRARLRGLIRKRASELNVSLKGSAFEGSWETADNAIGLAFNIDQPRDAHGRWSGIPGNMRGTASMKMAERAGLIKALGHGQEARREERGVSHPGFKYSGQAGGAGHLRAIYAEAARQRIMGNEVAANALHNVTRFTAMRDLKNARVHLGIAADSLNGQAGNLAAVNGIRESLNAVPASVSKRLPYSHGGAPASLRARTASPGYHPSPTSVVGTAWEGKLAAIELASNNWGPWDAMHLGRKKNARAMAGLFKLHGKQKDEYSKLRGQGHSHKHALSMAQQVDAGNPPIAGQHVSKKEARAWASLFQATNDSPALELSAKTGALAVTPHPFGKPGGPGLWHVKGMELPPYIQNIARALLRTGRAKSLGQAIAIARGATKRWAAGGGKVHPEVRAASAATSADWSAKQARAHAHAITDELDIIDLTVIELDSHALMLSSAQPRNALGQWTTGDQSQAQAGHRKGADAHQKHMAHIAHLRHLASTGRASAAQKAQLARLMKAVNTRTASKGTPRPARAGSKSTPLSTRTASISGTQQKAITQLLATRKVSPADARDMRTGLSQMPAADADYLIKHLKSLPVAA